MKKLIILITFFSCSKQEIKDDCKYVCIVSEKYLTPYENLYKIDTLRPNLTCGRWLDSIKLKLTDTIYLPCVLPVGNAEKWYYIIKK